MCHDVRVSDNGSNWQAPGSPGPTESAPPRFGEWGPAVSGEVGAAPGSGPAPGPGVAPGSPPASGPGAAPGWTPPPKPGLIPLRPLSFGTLLGAPFQALRRNPKPTFGAALIVQAAISVLSLLVVGGVSFFAFGRLTGLSDRQVNDLLPGSIAAVLLSSLLPVALAVIASALLQGIVVIEVSRAALGEKLRLGELWRRVRPRFGRLIGWTLLVAGIVLVLLAVLAGMVFLGVLLGPVGIAVGVSLTVLLALGLTVVGVWIGVKLSLVPSAIVVERLPLRAAVRRSWTLTTGYFWRTFGVQILLAMILGLVSSVITGPLSLGFTLGGYLIDPNGTGGALIALTVISYLLQLIFAVLIGAVSSVVQSAAVSLIYLDLRMRKEGLDLDLVRYVERGANADLPDPYLPPRA